MRSERAAARDTDQPSHSQDSSLGNSGPQLKIAERTRVQNLVDLAYTLLREVEALGRDKQFADHFNRLTVFDLSEGIDFYQELELFETTLIKLALKQTGGHQARAASLLHINPTTLNSKIKLYGIKY